MNLFEHMFDCLINCQALRTVSATSMGKSYRPDCARRRNVPGWPPLGTTAPGGHPLSNISAWERHNRRLSDFVDQINNLVLPLCQRGRRGLRNSGSTKLSKNRKKCATVLSKTKKELQA